jgi:hypothetical protein
MMLESVRANSKHTPKFGLTQSHGGGGSPQLIHKSDRPYNDLNNDPVRSLDNIRKPILVTSDNMVPHGLIGAVLSALPA